MKKYLVLSSAFLLTICVIAQPPEKMSYQAIIRDAGNNLVKDQAIGMQISILQGTVDGASVYTETQTPTTNSNGLVSIEIGTGTTSDDFSAIDWTNGPYFIKTETDPAGGTNYTITGTSQLLSVPYALHAKSAESLSGTLPETDPVYGSSAASGITASDITNWNNKLDNEQQNLSDVIALDNSANGQIKNLTDPTDDQDAVTKSYVDQIKEEIEEIQVSSGLIVKDLDGNIYPTLHIGSQVWMASNLRTTRYNDGSYIPKASAQLDWSSLSTPGYCWYENDSTSYADIFGAIYNWYTVNTGNLCPAGWHVSTDNDWKTLEMTLGMSETDANIVGYHGSNEGSKLAGKKPLWVINALTNDPEFGVSGFLGVPGGRRRYTGEFYDKANYANLWTADEYDADSAWHYSLYSLDTRIGYNNGGDKGDGYSVRCVKDY
jgi:uncharacterized protein (TIGR02145 family)